MICTHLCFPPSLKLSMIFLLAAVSIAGCSWFGPEPVALTYSRVETLQHVGREIGEPFGIAIKDDTIFVSDGAGGAIFAIEPGGSSRIFASGLNTPSGIALLPDGNMVVADTGSHTIRKISPDGEVSILAGIENVPGADDGTSRSATFNAPTGVATTRNGEIYVSDTYNDRIRVIEGHGVVTTIAGGVRGFADGRGSAALFDTPLGIAVWDDRLLVADSTNRRLRVVERTGDVWTLAGTGHSGLIDGSLSSASFVMPTAIAVGPFGQLFIADGNAVRVIGRRPFPFVETIAGGRHGLEEGSATAARFNRPSGLAVDQGGEVYIADSDNGAVRLLSDRVPDKRETGPALRTSVPLPLATRWPYDPPNTVREVAGTLGEVRGEIGTTEKPVWFHNGLDIAGAYGEVAKFIRDETVLDPHSVENVGTARELLRLPTIGYIHLRLGRDRTDTSFGDRRFQFERDGSGRVMGLRVPRGAHFSAGEILGTLNSQNHVHLVAGRSGNEINALAALTLPGISDTIAPTIEGISLFTEDWQEIETGDSRGRIKLTDRTRIVARAYDRMDGNSERRRLGVYKVGYQVMPKGMENNEVDWTIVFDRMPSNDAIRFAYAPGSKSGYTPETVFGYIASNRLSGDHFAEEFLDPARLAPGEYVLRVFAADFFGNTASKDIDLEVLK